MRIGAVDVLFLHHGIGRHATEARDEASKRRPHDARIGIFDLLRIAGARGGADPRQDCGREGARSRLRRAQHRAHARVHAAAPAPTLDQVRLALRRVKDPELNLNIVDLGLVYDMAVDERSRAILRARWMDEPKATLHDLADEYGVSAERIRQIESAALKKIKGALAAYV